MSARLEFHDDRVFAPAGTRFVFGLDEVGRGCVAGPVVAACVGYEICDNPVNPVPVRIYDSKKVSEKMRAQSVGWIQSSGMSHSVVEISAEEIDQTNILIASLKAMTLAFEKCREQLKLSDQDSFVILVDGNQRPRALPADRVQCLVKGDSRSFAIAAAALVAKEHRDQLMVNLANDFPHYGWQSNVGYLSAAHKQAVQTHGLSPWHRRSFRIL